MYTHTHTHTHTLAGAASSQEELPHVQGKEQWLNFAGAAMKEMEIPDHLTCLLRNLYAGQEATVRTGDGTTDWFQTGKRVRQGCILSPCLFNFHTEYIMRNAGLEETQAGIKIARRNINNLRYVVTPHLWQKAKKN